MLASVEDRCRLEVDSPNTDDLHPVDEEVTGT